MNSSPTTPVVAGVSGSPASSQGVEAAAREAQTHGLALHLVHAISHRPDRPYRPQLFHDLLAQARAAADRAAPGLRITTELVEGRPLNGLLRLSRRTPLIVIGDGNLDDDICLPPDATAVQLAARAHCTVMVARATPTSDGAVLAAVSGPTMSGRVLDVAFDAAGRRRTGLIVIHVGDTPDRVHAIEDVIASRAKRQRVDTKFRVLTGEPTAVLRRESEQASLVIVGARGELPYHGLLGSVAQTLLHHSHSPIVVVHGTGDRDGSMHPPCWPHAELNPAAAPPAAVVSQRPQREPARIG